MLPARGYPVLGITFLTPISGLDTCPDWGAKSHRIHFIGFALGLM